MKVKITCILFCYLFILGCSNNKIFVPKEILPQNNIFIGQSFSKLKESRDIKEGSADYHYEILYTSKYFNTVYYHSKWGAVSQVSFEKFYKKEDEINIDSLAKELMQLCINIYGTNYKILDVSYGSYKLPGLHWTTPEGGYAMILYTPHNEVIKIRGKQKRIDVFLSFQLSRINKWKTSKESECYTKMSLGLE